jgi:hypothetical protein
MTYRANPVLEKLDRAVEYTGVPALGRWSQRALPLPFRIAPALLIGVAAIALVARAWWGLSLIMLIWSISGGLYAFGPLRTPPDGQRDERERQLMRDGHFAGMAVTLGAAIIGCMVFTFGSAFAILGWSRIWVPSGPMDWAMLALFLMILEVNAALMAGSWMMPRRLRDESGSDD